MYKSGNKKRGKKLAEEEQDIFPKDDLLMLGSEWLGDMWNLLKPIKEQKDG